MNISSIKILAFFILSFFVSFSFASGINSATHKLYESGDNYWLIAQPHVVIIASEISIPLLLPPLYENIFLRSDGDEYKVHYTSGTSISVCRKRDFSGSCIKSTRYNFSGDEPDISNQLLSVNINDDGISDVLIRAKNSSSKTIVLISGNVGQAPTAHQVIGGTDLGVDISLTSGYKLTFSSGTIIAEKEGEQTLISTLSSSNKYQQFKNKIYDYSVDDEIDLNPIERITPNAVGAGDYSPAVSPSGNLSLSFPVAAPLGMSASMTPVLSVQYSSQSSNGLLGKGFNLSGLSMIHRCNKSIKIDGLYSNITYSDSDAICLNGKRLLPVDASNTLVDGSEFRTELDVMKKIILTKSNSHYSFEVFNKDGTVDEYSTAAKTIGRSNNAEYAWYITKKIDRFANEVVYKYKKTSHGEVLIDEILYDSSKVSFEYNETIRNDSVIKFTNGNQYRRTKYLKKITTYGNSAGVLVKQREYRYVYADEQGKKYSDLTGHLLLKAVQECAYEISGSDSSKECKEASEIDWPELSSFNFSSGTDGATPTSVARQQTGVLDWNNDGRGDLFVLSDDLENEKGVLKIHLSGEDGVLKEAIDIIEFSEKWPIEVFPMDLDNNGTPEFLYQKSNRYSGPYHWFILWNGVEEQRIWDHQSPKMHSAPLSVDIDGDGYQDIVGLLKHGEWKVYNNVNGQINFYGTKIFSSDHEVSSGGARELIYLGRVEGEALVLAKKNSFEFYVVKINKNFVAEPEVHRLKLPNSRYMPIDVNGDGLRDIISIEDNHLVIFIFDGKKFNKVKTLIPESVLDFNHVSEIGESISTNEYRKYPIKIIDVNDDNLQDLVFVEEGRIKFLLSNGTGFNPASIDAGKYIMPLERGGEAILPAMAEINIPNACKTQMDYFKLAKNMIAGKAYDISENSFSGQLFQGSKKIEEYELGKTNYSYEHAQGNTLEADLYNLLKSSLYLDDTVYNVMHSTYWKPKPARYVLEINPNAPPRTHLVNKPAENSLDYYLRLGHLSDEALMDIHRSQLISTLSAKRILDKIRYCHDSVDGLDADFLAELNELTNGDESRTGINGALAVYNAVSGVHEQSFGLNSGYSEHPGPLVLGSVRAARAIVETAASSFVSTFRDSLFGMKYNPIDVFKGKLDGLNLVNVNDYHLTDTNGDNKLDIVKQYTQNSLLVMKNVNSDSELVFSITNASGIKTEFNYSTLADPAVHTQGVVAGDDIPFNAPLSVAKSMVTYDTSDNALTRSEMSYKYNSFMFNTKGYGLLGAKSYSVIDDIKKAKTTTYFQHSYPYIGLVDKIESFVGEGSSKVKVNTVDFTWNTSTSNTNNQSKFVSIDKKETFSYELGSKLYSQVLEDFTYDVYGNKTYEKTEYKNGVGETVRWQQIDSVFNMQGDNNNVNEWLISFADQVTETYGGVNNGYDLIGRSSANKVIETFNTAYLDTLAVDTSKRFSEGHEYYLKVDNDYNGFGQLISSETSGKEIKTRKETYSDFQNNRWPRKVTHSQFASEDGEAGSIERIYDGRFGSVISEKDYNNRLTTNSYDAFGRLATTANAYAVETVNTYAWCPSSPSICSLSSGAEARYFITSSSPDAADSAKYFDAFDREVKTSIQGFSLSDAYLSEVKYDQVGRKISQSLPFTQGDQAQFINYSNFDLMQRPLTITSPDGGIQNYTYAFDDALGMRTHSLINTITDGTTTLNQERQDTVNALGDIVKSIQAKGSADQVVSYYDYNPQGKLDWSKVISDQSATEITAAGIVTSMKFDQLGNRLQLNDPDVGTITESYDALGFVVTKTDAKNQQTTYDYDQLDRMITRTEVDAVSQWYYDNDVECKLDDTDPTIKLPLGALCRNQYSDGRYVEEYGYNDHADIVFSVSQIAAQADQPLKQYVNETLYDGFGRVSGTIYDSDVTILNGYSDTGYLESIYRKNNAAQPYWQLNEFSAFSKVTKATLGNGSVTINNIDEKSGRITAINSMHAVNGLIQNENFAWYSNSMLSSRNWQRNSSVLTESYTYDALNRLKSANGVSGRGYNYSYDKLGNIKTKTGLAGQLEYGQLTGGVQAGAHAITHADGVSYHYDKNGNMIKRGADTVMYTSFNKPKQINTDSKSESFAYGPNRFRYRQSTADKTTYYAPAGGYEEVVIAGQPTEQKHYIGQHALLTLKDSVETIEYFHRNHQGSLSAISDATGQLIQELNYSPFGARTEGDSSVNARGYTDHEHLTESGLIHMNGRVYDPLLGRFLSADILVQSPFNSQSYNRYSYVWNSPMSLVDPSGWAVQELFGGLSNTAEWLNLKDYQPTGYVELTPYSNYFANEVHSLGAGAINTMAFGVNMFAHGVNTSFNILGLGIDFSFGVIGELTGIGKREVYRTSEAMLPSVGKGLTYLGMRKAARVTKSVDNSVIVKPRVGNANKTDPTHRFNDIIDNYAGDATKFDIPTKGPGGQVVRTSELRQVEGGLNGKSGVFEWIVDQGNVTHRRFIPGGKVTGFPNQVLKK